MKVITSIMIPCGIIIIIIIINYINGVSIRVYLGFLFIGFMLLPFCPYIGIYIPQLSQ